MRPLGLYKLATPISNGGFKELFINGATSSAIIYSIAETAKANNLKPYDYFEYLLTEIPKHEEDTNTDFLKALLPWSETLSEHIRKPVKGTDK
jgi:transposase